MTFSASDAARLWSKVDKVGGPAACWPWTAARHRNGYGAFSISTGGVARRLKAHRVVYQTSAGPIPDGLFVCHSCDHPWCCNPAHLFVGTAAENTADMFAKGRQVRGAGEDHSQAKLTWADVRAIRSSADSGVALAARYGVSRSMVCRIRAHLAWKEPS